MDSRRRARALPGASQYEHTTGNMSRPKMVSRRVEPTHDNVSVEHSGEPAIRLSRNLEALLPNDGSTSALTFTYWSEAYIVLLFLVVPCFYL
jgi:hypothetical protein